MGLEGGWLFRGLACKAVCNWEILSQCKKGSAKRDGKRRERSEEKIGNDKKCDPVSGGHFGDPLSVSGGHFGDPVSVNVGHFGDPV